MPTPRSRIAACSASSDSRGIWSGEVIIAHVVAAAREDLPRAGSPGSSRVPIWVLRDVRRDREHRRAVALAVVEAVEQVQAAGPGRAEHRRRAPGDLGVGAGRERAGLLVAHVHELDLGRVAAQRVDDRVGRVADDPVDLADPGFDHLVDEDFGNGLGHGVSSSRLRSGGSPATTSPRWTASIGIVDLDAGDAGLGRGLDHVDGDRRGDLAQPVDARAAAPWTGPRRRPARRCARAAARNSGSDITEARQTIVPSPSPGNISALLACPIRYVLPSRSTGPNGLPVATSACAVGPGQQVRRRLLGQHRRVGHRQDDRPLAVRVHRAHDLLGERAGDARGPDEHRRMQVVDDLGEPAVAVRRRASPATLAGSLAYGRW